MPAINMDPFHDGERLAQQRAGETEMADKVGGIIRDVITAPARTFLEQQTLVVVATEAGDGTLWSSPLFGDPGFVRSRDGREVVLDLTRVARSVPDPFWTNVREDTDVGLLAIDLETRKRLRVNVRATSVTAAELCAVVREAYPNCPKYIQRRRSSTSAAPQVDFEPSSGCVLDAERRAIVERADTFFIASRHAERGADASHRGGRPGFVRVVDPRTLRIPDYAGNGMYNTVGNLIASSRAGLAFLDFASGRLLQLTGVTRVFFDQPDPGNETGGTGRFWQLSIERWIDSSIPVARRWELLDFSPYNP